MESNYIKCAKSDIKLINNSHSLQIIQIQCNYNKKKNPRKLISKTDTTIQRFTQKCQEPTLTETKVENKSGVSTLSNYMTQCYLR